MIMLIILFELELDSTHFLTCIICLFFKVYMDESVQEVDSLNSRIQELGAQLCKENEECKR